MGFGLWESATSILEFRKKTSAAGFSLTAKMSSSCLLLFLGCFLAGLNFYCFMASLLFLELEDAGGQ